MIKSEKGGISIIAIIMIVGFTLMAFVLLDFFSIFISKHQAQTAADSATKSAMIILEEKYLNKLDSKAEDSLEHFFDEVPTGCVGCGVEDGCGCSDLDRVRHITKGNDLDSLEYQLASAFNGNNPDNVNVSLLLTSANNRANSYFRGDLGPASLGEILYNSAYGNSEKISKKAQKYSKKNLGKSEIKIIFFRNDKPKVEVETRRDVTSIFLNMSLQDMKSIGSSKLILEDYDGSNLNIDLENQEEIVYDTD